MEIDEIAGELTVLCIQVVPLTVNETSNHPQFVDDVLTTYNQIAKEAASSDYHSNASHGTRQVAVALTRAIVARIGTPDTKQILKEKLASNAHTITDTYLKVLSGFQYEVTA